MALRGSALHCVTLLRFACSCELPLAPQRAFNNIHQLVVNRFTNDCSSSARLNLSRVVVVSNKSSPSKIKWVFIFEGVK